MTVLHRGMPLKRAKRGILGVRTALKGGQLHKALSERELIRRLLARQTISIRSTFNQMLEEVSENTTLHDVRELLQRGAADAALALLEELLRQHVILLTKAFQDVFSTTAQAEIRRISKMLRIRIDFEPGNPRAVALMRRNRLNFIKEFTSNQRSATRLALTEAVRTGQGATATARAFRNSIGLTEHQYSAVLNYERLLMNGSAEALDRQLRDRRFDSTVTGAVRDGKPLSGTQIDSMVDRYHDRFIDARAITIARTEAQKIINQARHEAMQQAMELTGLDEDLVERTWLSTRDKRVRDTHAGMDGQTRGMDEPFDSPSGAHLMFPGDPQAPASEIINCRCAVAFSIKKV